MNDINIKLMENPNKAYEIGFKSSTELRNNVDKYMFILATSNQLQFKNIATREYLKINY